MIYFLNDHKTGYAITNIIADKINILFQSNIKIKHYFKFWHEIIPKDKYVIFIRHPYEIITSGYCYHKVCTEAWAINTNISYYKGWEEHFTRDEILRNINNSQLTKRKAIKKLLDSTILSVENKTYQDILNDLSLIDGLKYEMGNVGYRTIMGMYEWPHYGKKNVLIIKFEHLMNDFINTIYNIFAFLKISDKNKIAVFIEEIDKHIITKMSYDEILNNNHITNKNRIPFVYKKIWTRELYAMAQNIFPCDLLSKFNYESH